MTEDIKSIILPELFSAITELAEFDSVVKSALEKSNDITTLINSLVATIICISDRELSNVAKISDILKSNPKIQELLQQKNDQLMLQKSSDK